jgi:tRNA(Ile)-lysidine synthase
VPDGLSSALEIATSRLIGRPIGADDRFALAVSGGADSMAMLSAAAQCWPRQIEAATVDHGLRAGARREAAMVARWCADHDVPHVILTPHKPITGNIQSEARTMRYRLLDTWREERGLTWLLTAHQADDQIETMLLRLNRGAGVGGLRSVQARRGMILRPLLGERRETLRAYCVTHDIPFVDDPSNADARFDRVRIRNKLSHLDLIDPAGLARSIEALTEAEDALDWMVEQLEAQHLRGEGDVMMLDRTDLPPAILRKILVRMIEKMNPEAESPRGPSIDQALVQLFNGRVIALADCLVAGGPTWTVRRAPPRRHG